ncbi:glycosyltransferase family 4 protein [Flavobacteriales bacterium]|nr:glycosyltransferase family 4 protein [Flavobacteriales bacterium]
MKQNIAIIDPLGAHGSSHHFYLFGQAEGLINNGCSISLYTNNETANPNIDGLRFFTFYKNIFKSKFKFISGIKWMIGSIFSVFHARFSGIIIFHFHIFYTNILVLFNLLLVKLLFGKVVLTIHDVRSFTNSFDSSIIERITYKLTDLILTHNEFSKSEIIKINPNLSSSIYIVPHGNYTPFINVKNEKARSRKHLEIPNNKKVLLFFGMIKEVKGLDVLLHALKDVIKENPDVLLLIAGKVWENDFTNYQRIIDENNLSDYCLLHIKFIPPDEVEHYYCAADLVVLPYKKIYQSGVLVMTLSYGKPALVSDLPPLKEVVTDMQTAFLFESKNSISLAEKLNLILLDSEKLEEVGINGEKLIKIKYNWNKIGRQTKQAYQSLY